MFAFLFGSKSTIDDVILSQKYKITQSIINLEREVGKSKNKEYTLTKEWKEKYYSTNNEINNIKLKEIYKEKQRTIKYITMINSMNDAIHKLNECLNVQEYAKCLSNLSKIMKTTNSVLNINSVQNLVKDLDMEISKFEFNDSFLVDETDAIMNNSINESIDFDEFKIQMEDSTNIKLSITNDHLNNRIVTDFDKIKK